MVRCTRPVFVLLMLGMWWLLGWAQQAPSIPATLDSLRIDSAAGNWTAYRKQAIKLAEHRYEQENFESAQAALEEALQVLTTHQQGESLEAARVWGWLAFICREQEQYVAALEAYRQAIRRYEGQQYQGQLLTYCYKNAAQVCIRWNNYRLANDYLQAGLRSDTAGTYRLSIYAQLANNLLLAR